MKNLKIFASSMLCIAAVMSSCSNEVETIVEQQDKATRAEATELLTVTYNGVTYQNVPTSYDENGDFVFLDSKFSPIYEKELANEENLSINIKSADEIEFFHSLKSNLESNGYDYADCQKEMTKGVSNGRNTRLGYNFEAILELFDDKNYGDPKLTYRLTQDVISVEERRLHYQSFNDKCSSLIITNNLPNDSTQSIKLGDFWFQCSKVDAVFVGYEDKDYAKKTVIYIASPGTRRMSPSLPGFNDKLSSFKFFFAQKGQYNEQ